ncbi:Carbohydrate esterase family 15 protein [Mycena indigotica]|uniref:Beta-xylanase n=1 Tax=Mycena indigotica TaxID=2126181 RepID=A0A8H6VZH0_9AGAR|nr:Carbohydrate esterase family 15 protein [Mycena indigotica]KAF7297496.1 Carbohydrate esterase family 15 protein [Mycena indigotica]
MMPRRHAVTLIALHHHLDSGVSVPEHGLRGPGQHGLGFQHVVHILERPASSRWQAVYGLGTVNLRISPEEGSANRPKRGVYADSCEWNRCPPARRARSRPSLQRDCASFRTATAPSRVAPSFCQGLPNMRLSFASVLLAITLVSGAVVEQEKRQAATSIDALFRAKGKAFLGVAADQGRLSVSQDAAITKANFGGVTPENSMKWDTIEASRGSFNWGQFDYLVNWAQTNNKLIRGHTFVWAQQLPSWVTAINDASTLTSVLQNHITQVMTRYKGKMYAVDVVNEHINEDGSIKSTHWTQVLGNNVFTIAFQTARQVDPSVKLYINDYNLDSNNAKVAGIVKLVNQLNSGGTKLVDGIGTQMHLSAGGSSGAQAALTALAAANVDVAITELDIASAPAADYTNVVKACLNVPKCVSITVWGVRDTDSWRASTNPLLFDSNWQPKAAYTAIANLLAQGGTTTTTQGNGGGTTTTTSKPPTGTGGTQQHWDQCGGEGWTGGTVCVSPYVCTVSNQWYSQCL